MWFASSAAKRLRYPVSLLVLASLYFVAGRLGLSLASVNPSASAVWPPTGIAIAAITLLGRRMWPAIMVGSFLVNLAQTGRSDSSLAIAVGNTAEALAGAWFLVRAGGARAFGDPRSIFRFIALSGMLSTAISATVGVTTLLLSGLAIRGDLWRIWLNWWVGDSISAWILTPLLVMAASVKVRRNLSKWRILETTALVLGLGLVHLLVFGGLIPGSARLYLLGYLGIPLFLCVAFRFGPLAASMAVTGSSIIAIWGTVGARGPFAPEDPDLSLVLLQLYLGSVSVTMVILAAVVKSYKNTGTELYHRQKRLDSIISSVPGIVWEIWRRQDEAAMHLDYVSPYVESMLGYTAEQWLSKPGFWLTIVHPDDKERLARETSEALAEGKDRVSTSRWIAKDGRVVEVESRSVVFLDPEGKPEGMLGVTMDITERRKTEERLRVAEEQVRYAQKMEAVGRLAGGVAHDFNNLLTAILGYCDLLLAKMQSPGPMTSYAKEIRGAAERAAALTRQLLAFSRKEIVQPRPMDLNGLIGYMDPALRRLLGGGIRLETSLHPDLYSLKADRNQIEQLITNLVENSRDAMPQGGAIAIETANARIPEEGSGFFLKPKCEDCVRLTVRDEGSGIPKEAMPHLFDPFFTTKSKTKGSGLGLSTVYAILERSGGGVRVISEPSMVGSAFHVYLPCTSKEAAPPDTSAEKRQDQGKTEKPRGEETGEEILVMAADAGLRRNITGILENRGYAVLEACDSMSALGQVRKLAKAPFLVILDTTDPDGNAIGLAEKLLAEHENLKVIFLVENIGSTRLPAAMPADRIRMVDNRLEPQRLFEIVREMTMAVPA